MMNRLRRNGSVLTGLITLLLLLGSFSAQAQTTNTWTGGTDTDWHTTTNWSLTLIPTATHNVVIPGSLTNYPILSGAASASTVEVRSGASLTISSAGSLTIDGSKLLVLGGFSYSMGFYNGGTVVNSGSLSVGTSSAMGQTALWNASSFTNMATGNITLDNSSLFNESGSSFVNSGNIRVGTSAAVGLSALWNASSFTNTATGNITLDRSSVSGLFNSGSFVNSGSVTAGSSAAVGAYALRNSSSFTNTATGNITLNNSRTSGLLNSSGGSFVNSATITIGTSLTGNAIQNDGTFTNQGGGCLNPAPGLINSLGDGVITNTSSFSNTGTIIERATGNSGISFNGGVIQNLNGGTFTVASSGGFSVAYVTPTGAGLRNGSSWTDAFSGTALQTAIDAVAGCGGGEVWVAAGLYKPTTGTSRTVSFSMHNNVAIYGGFAGSETALSGRPTINPVTGQPSIGVPSSSTLSGDIGTTGNAADNSYHVIYNPAIGTPTGLSLNNTAVLDGFVIADGNANGSSFPNIAGGGMFNAGNGAGQVCSPLIRNCAFQNNSAVSFGGAMYNDGRTGGTSSPSLINCLFQNNTAGTYGGAINNNGNFSGGTSSPILTNCAFQSNTAGSEGGAMFNTASGGTSSPILTNCSFQSNSAANGGAMTNNNTSSPRLTNCAFQNNAATVDGGAINNNGGGGNSSPILTNCSFQSNTAGRDGGAMFNIGSGGTSSPVMTNCVVWGNGGNKTFVNYNATGISASYSLFENTVANYSATNSLTVSVSPFASTTGMALNACSPAINAGNPASTSATGAPAAIGTTDLVGNPRFFNAGRIDMGAVEFQGAGPAQTTLTAAPSTTLTCTQTSLTLTATGGTSYTFAGPGLNQSGSMATAVVSQSGVYSVTATDATGCTSMTSITITAGNTTPTASLTVTSNADNGPNTLRQAMLDVMATTCPGPFTITVTASGTINLAGALPAITKSIVFLGPGAANLSIRRNTGGDYRLFDISANQTVSFDGFTLADGNATGSSPASKGGAIYMNSGSSLTVTNCVFNANRASEDGGAIYSEASQLVLSNCRFTGNTAGGFGGVLESYTPNPVITNCFFTNNTASVGGAVDFYNSSPNITNCAFVGNSAGSGNGGAIATLNGTATVTNSSFRQNTGGTGPGQAQAIKNESSSFSLNNSILFGNGVGQPITNGGSSTVVAQYSLFEPSVTGYTDGGNNRTTTLSPFASTTGVALNACSPAIDAGNPASTTAANEPYSATNLPTLDVTGNARIVAGLVDMGAVEYVGPGSFTTTLTVGPSSTITCAQTSLTLTATGGASYTFAGPGLSQSGSMATAVVSQSGVFSVTATDATGCTTSASTTVYSNTLTPTAGLVASGTITCSVPAVTLTASGATGIPGGTYTFGGPSIVSTAGNLATVNVGGTYSVTVLNPANGCFATNTVSVSSDLGGAPPAPTLSASLSVVCAGATIMVVTTGGVAPMQWYLNGSPVSGQTSATLSLGGVQAAQAGSYVLVLTGACSVTSAPFSLTVNPLPTVTILVPQGSMVNGPGTGVATITLPAPLTGVAMQALGGTSYERLIILDRINGFEIRQVDQNTNGIFNVNRTGPFSLTATDGNGCKRTVEGTVLTR